MSFKEKFKGFMYRTFSGCHGMDQLNWGLFFMELILSIVAGFFSNRTVLIVFQIVNWIIWGIVIFRMLSKNQVKRNHENYKFICFWNPAKVKIHKFFLPLTTAISKAFARMEDKDHKYFRCSCGTYLRVPRGKGKIKISCSKCGKQMIRKS